LSNDTKQRRRPRGRAWHWRQTDCWYYTPPGTRRRVRLLDEEGQPIRGRENRPAAELALARVKAAGNWRPAPVVREGAEPWLVAKICSEFATYCQRWAASGTVSPDYAAEAARYLDDFCEYCGALSVHELRKGHVRHWLESHATWASPATQRNAVTAVLSAFIHAEEMLGAPNPLRGLKKPPQRPRLQSFTPEEEQTLYDATDGSFRDFLFAAIHTGLRPFCELAKLTADDVEEIERGMMWRVRSSKTGKTRKVPVRRDVAELTRRLANSLPAKKSSPLFRNSQGNPWKKVTGVARFRRLKTALGWDKDPQRRGYSCYTCRHTFAHRMLAGYWNGGRGCSIEVLAELMGDTPKVAFDHYGREWGQHYQEPLWAAVGLGEDVSSEADPAER